MVTSSLIIQLDRPIAKSARAVFEAVPGLEVVKWRNSTIAVAVKALSKEEAEAMCKQIESIPGVIGVEWMGYFFEDIGQGTPLLVS